ncbi:MAG: segregation/condensation protein A [Bacilli bacterium]|nr:segregation/condensation protein A [Bacilli bacterium]
MDIKITIDKFEGPLDLLLHLIKQSDIDIYDIEINEITKQYMDYINSMEKMNLNVASEYLIMAAELMEIKSSSLLPKPDVLEDDYEIDKREQLIQRLIEYQKYKEMTPKFHELEESRKMIFTRDPSNLNEYRKNDYNNDSFDVDILVNAFYEFLKRKEEEKPLNTKITKKEYSISERSIQIRSVLKNKRKVKFLELFDIYNKPYIVVTFLAVLSMARKNEINIKQDNNFEDIVIESVKCDE